MFLLSKLYNTPESGKTHFSGTSRSLNEFSERRENPQTLRNRVNHETSGEN